MKIVHVISGYLPQETGGAQLHLRDLCHAQRRRGHETHVFARIGGRDGEELQLRRDEWEGVAVTRLTHNFLACDSFEKIFSNPAIDRVFAGFLDQEQPDLVHMHHLSGLSISMIDVSKQRRLPVALTLQDYWLVCPRGQRIHPDDLSICEPLDRRRCLPCVRRLVPHLLPEPAPAGPLTRWLAGDPGKRKLRDWESDNRRRLALCDATIAPSRFHRDRFVEWGLAARRCHVVPHGLPKDEILAPPRGTRPIEHLGFIGTVIPSKGPHVLIEAFNLLGRRDLTLEIHGEVVPFFERTSYRQELEAMVEPGLSVRFHGRYENRELPAILETLDLLVVPALWWESFCLTAREGALAGLPVIASKLGGLADAVEDGIALGCDPGDAAQLAELIERLCRDEALRDAMSRKAHLVPGIEQCSERIEEIYRRLV